jgi:hypothetical protein
MEVNNDLVKLLLNKSSTSISENLENGHLQQMYVWLQQVLLKA